MKRKLLALLVALTMVASIFVAYSANAGTLEEATVYSQDFEEDGSAYSVKAAYTGADYNGAAGLDSSNGVDGSKCFTVQSTTYGNAVTNALITTLDPEKNYRMTLQAYGDISMLKLADAGDNVFATIIDLGASIGSYERSYKEFSVDFTGQSTVKFFIKVQASNNYFDGNLYIDNIKIYDVDLMPTPEPYVPAPEPTIEPTPEVVDPTQEPQVTLPPSESPTIEPTIGPCPPFTNIKFAKKSVKIKKGKKVVLKVKVGGTAKVKKVKYSVSKKKIIKIVKKNNKKVTIKALKKGKVTLFAKANKKTAKCKIAVKK